MLRNPVSLKVVSVEQPTAEQVRSRLRADLRAQLQALKPDSKDTRTSTQLLDTLEAYDPEGDVCHIGQDRLVKMISQRLNRLRQVKGAFRSRQERDLMIILLFGERKLPPDLRLDACALLKLGGTNQASRNVCIAYPGFRRVFEK